jgi:hypothetical protein
MKQLVVVVVQIKAKGEGMSLFRRRNSPNEWLERVEQQCCSVAKDEREL